MKNKIGDKIVKKKSNKRSSRYTSVVIYYT